MIPCPVRPGRDGVNQPDSLRAGHRIKTTMLRGGFDLRLEYCGRPSKWLALAAALAAAALPLVVLLLLGSAVGSASAMNTSPTGGPLSDIPPEYLALCMNAAQTCQGLPWGVLAGIGEAENDHGQSTVPGVLPRCMAPG